MIIRQLGLTDYNQTFDAMKAFNAQRDETIPDEIWLTEHNPVYTLGLAGKPEHLLGNDAGARIPVVKTDRGGQITYHGPGQALAYLMLDVRRRDYGVKELVRRVEQSLIETLHEYGIKGERRDGMPGVYVQQAKIAALGLRVARHCTYHGLSLNVANNLAPFDGINPCGYAGLTSTRMVDFNVRAKMSEVQQILASRLIAEIEK